MFHVNVPDVLAYTVKLLRKAYQSGAETQVLIGPYDAQRLSAMLWASPEADFLPHAIYSPDRFRSDRSRVRLWLDAAQVPQAVCPVVVNLALSEVAHGPACALTKVIEVVDASEASVVAARHRWRIYAARGWSPQKHERT